MPTSKMPTTVNCFRRGKTAAGVTMPCGAISVTLSPAKARSAWASSAPRTMPNSPGCSRSSAPTFMWRGKIGHAIFLRRQNAAHQYALHLPVERQHALLLHVGRGRDHTRMARDAIHRLLPVFHFAIGAGNLRVRSHAENARAQLLLETVHHRQHDNQRRHAERQAQHGNQRDEGNEAIAAARLAGGRVAQPDQRFKRGFE